MNLFIDHKIAMSAGGVNAKVVNGEIRCSICNWLIKKIGPDGVFASGHIKEMMDRFYKHVQSKHRSR